MENSSEKSPLDAMQMFSDGTTPSTVDILNTSNQIKTTCLMQSQSDPAQVSTRDTFITVCVFSFCFSFLQLFFLVYSALKFNVFHIHMAQSEVVATLNQKFNVHKKKLLKWIWNGAISTITNISTFGIHDNDKTVLIHESNLRI